jgi:hypothetical protein
MKVLLNEVEVRVLMNMRNLTAVEASRRVGITPEHYCRLLKGLYSPTPKVRRGFLKAFSGAGWDRLFRIEGI